MNRVWTEEELEILRRDREAKVPVPVTAAKLGRPVPATYARARLIGTLVQPHQSWDEASVARLRALVSADPPMTDKSIAAELGRSVTQIRWKMQDLGLIGVRDLSKLAKITASQTARPKAVRQPCEEASPKAAADRIPSSSRTTSVRDTSSTRASASDQNARPAAIDPQAALEKALKALEAFMAERLASWIAESEAGMIKAARAAIAEKARIDQRLTVRVKRAGEARRKSEAEQEAAKHEAQLLRDAEAARQAEEAARQARERAKLAARKPVEKPKPVEKKPVLTAAQGVSQAASPRPALPPVKPEAPKIVVTEAPSAIRPVEEEPASAQISGRGGWKSVRRDPARAMAQAKAKAKPANRADAVDLAQAAQAAIERFIAERGVTRTETDGIQAIVSRLQARGYIVVRDENGWTVDQRHRIDNESDLLAFAEARGITFSAAA